MERYSIFGSNEDENLLKLQNNQSNIKIDIHNKDHNFTIEYVSSNEIITEYNTLGLKDITTIDENNYIHKSISNSSNVIIQGEYDGNQNDINDIFQIIASILHLSNINPENGDIVWEKINIISSLLGINTEELINLFTEKEIKVGDEIFKINYENQEISVVIDSFMKIIYVQLL